MARRDKPKRALRKAPRTTVAKKMAAQHRDKLKGAKVAPPVLIKKSSGAIRIKYSDPRHVLPHLLSLASEFAGRHFGKSIYTAAADDVLGTEAAKKIVAGCANSDCWNCTLGGLKLDSDLFQTCVFNGVAERGFHIDRNQIPASQDTQLYTVVLAIQGAKR